ncbi:MAG: formyltransferase family protein [Archangium sp.]|nr:formyltransferase family protein [Archangium sp.]MDP3575833.1 formyltransferase family protein [Archangium sp.]
MLVAWTARHARNHQTRIVRKVAELDAGELLFLISCHEIVRAEVRARFGATLVIHASDLPVGRGWSPHIWQILEGKNEIPVTLLQAEDGVDSGAIWAQTVIRLQGHEMAGEINEALFAAESELMDQALELAATPRPRAQDSRAPTYYPKRSRTDSELDPNKTIAEQFDLLRVCDNDRYPAFFRFRGHSYIVKIEKGSDHE